MDAFTAVVTTGIYCQPACSALPRAENTRSFPLAAAAEAAGYRACLRCRPYRYPQTLRWDAPEFVCRGVRLILDGALDCGTEEELAARLGVSARHLRRLFVAHVGVTPDRLARSARAHFARRLLDDTDLSVTEVAFAAGFGSLRQFNRACREVFRDSPRGLRARRRKADRLVADGGLPLRLAYTGVLDWPALLEYLATRAIPGIEHVEDDAYRRTIVVDGHPGVLELQPGDADHLVLVAHLPRWRELVHIVQRARHIANLDLSLEEPQRVLTRDPIIGPLLRQRPGLRPPGTWDPFEAAVGEIVRVHTEPARAKRVLRRLVEHFGTRVAGLEQLALTHTFPSPARLARGDLTEHGIASRLSRSLEAFARAVEKDEIRLDRSVSLEQLLASLAAVDVDACTAHSIALRLGEPDAFPASEVLLQCARSKRAVHTATGFADDGERWRPWRAVAATQFSFALEAGELEERVSGAA